MANIALFVPFQDMLEKAKHTIKKNNYQVSILKCINTYEAVDEARNAIFSGVDIIIARGQQAKLIKQYTNIPLVEIRFHPSEIGLMIQKAKSLTGLAHPHIAFIIHNNMLCDMSYMEELFQVELSIHYIEDSMDAALYVSQLSGKADIIIGGQMAHQAAEESGIPSLLLKSTELSISEALQTAKRMIFAQEMEKQNSAQVAAILNTTSNGIIKINPNGNITLINQYMETILEKHSSNIIGTSLYELLPQIEKNPIQEILNGKRESYVSSIMLQGVSWVLVVSPIQYESKISGAILAIQTTHTITHASNHLLTGHSAHITFDHIPVKNNCMLETLSLAKTYAVSNSPVLIYGQTGTEYYYLAEAIHNNSVRKSGPFVSVNINGLNEQQQMEIILGNSSSDPNKPEDLKSAIIKAHQGTLLLCGVENLSPYVQHELYRLMLPTSIAKTEAQRIDTPNIRIIAVCHDNLAQRVSRHLFSEELFYKLQRLTLTIPPLSQRPEDFVLYFDAYFNKYCQKYNRFFGITEGAYNKLKQLNWSGNLIQMDSFVERLVITSQKRRIDEVQIENLYHELYPFIHEVNGVDKIVVYQSPEALELEGLMKKHHGNRSKIAKELGISTTTLWRHLKKYGIS